MRTLFRDVEVEGLRTDVLVGPRGVEAVSPGLAPDGITDLVDGRGGALIPGFHDHHIHLLAAAAARESVDCRDDLTGLQAAPDGAWVRGVNASVSVDRHALDALVPDRPTRVQHRSGALWMLNSRALSEVSTSLVGPGVERDARGEPTGRLWRFDSALRTALPMSAEATRRALSALVGDLHRWGITSVTDATPDLDPSAIRLLEDIDLGVTLLGAPHGSAPWKLLLHDHDLPSLAELVHMIHAQHSQGRPVALHCVSRESLLLTLAALDDAGRMPGDRIEHGAVIPDEVRSRLRGLIVVTQPGMLVDRSADYRRDVAADDLACLYPHASLLAEGIETWISSDAPYGPGDPWEVLLAARDRSLNPEERTPVRQAAASLFLDASGRPRRIAAGVRTSVCLLHVDWATACADPHRDTVRLVRDYTRVRPTIVGE